MNYYLLSLCLIDISLQWEISFSAILNKIYKYIYIYIYTFDIS